MRINLGQVEDKILFLIAVVMIIIVGAVGSGESGENPKGNVVAEGDGFVMTQENVDTFNVYFESQNQKRPRKELIHIALKYELLSREYIKNHDSQLATPGSESVALKVSQANKYIQKVLDDWEIPGVVIESFYRANPEKFKSGTASDGKIIVMPIDDALREDIRFMIIESKKELIVKELVDKLIIQYRIKIFESNN